jgi:hypothetical protein
MGAYYTQEDVTGYITQNVVIPYLFDAAREGCAVAFEPGSAMWSLLSENPDRYIYEAVLKGVDEPLPEEIAAGVNDVSKRGDWNRPADEEYALPTETWREYVARWQRCEELRRKLSSGEVHEISDLVTLNLNIRQFAQDAIESAEEPELVRAFYAALKDISVLDPTCGSGAFLFAALNILEPLYEACLERMQRFVDEDASNEGYTDFRRMLSEMERHLSQRYFSLKSIMVNNLYGVDIMEEAVEIARLRLFLKLMALVENESQIEPLPDLDFNLRAGNTLVGFAALDEVQEALGSKLDFANSRERIEAKASEADDAFQIFRWMQIEEAADSEELRQAKANVREKLLELHDELDRYLAAEYGVDAREGQAFQVWRLGYQPFHWLVEFYSILEAGGFDVIIGNPPYVEYRLVKDAYQVLPSQYQSESTGNLYALCMERSVALEREGGRFGMIVPAGAMGLGDAESLREVLLSNYISSYCSTYAIRPSKLFNGVDQRLCIYLGKAGRREGGSALDTTKYHHWNSEERPSLFARLQYVESLYYSGRRAGYLMHYHRSPRYWIRAMDFEPHFKSPTRSRSVHHYRNLYFADPKIAKVAGAVLNSSLFFFWFVTVGNGRNITGTDVEQFPLGDPSDDMLQELPSIFDQLMTDYKDNSIIRVRQDSEFQEFRPSLSKPIIDRIDRVLASHYGFTDEELDFIINYDIKYRMGAEQA